MNYQGGFETFKESTKYMFKTPDLFDILTILFVLSFAIGMLIIFPYYISKRARQKSAYKDFLEYAYSLGLTKEETELLWSCTKEMAYSPNKLLTSKPVFEKCVSLLVKKESSNIDLINTIRKKLHFDYVPWFLPMTTTRELDLYQTGFLTHQKEIYNAAVWEKDELSIHIALLDALKLDIKPGDTVKFSFTREDEGKYSFSGKVKEVYYDGYRPVIVLDHAEKLNKLQLRESIRWKVNLPAKVYLFKEKVNTNAALLMLDTGDLESIEGRIENISVGGVRFCAKYIPEVFEDQVVVIVFDVDKRHLEAACTVRNRLALTNRYCLGLKFETLTEEEKDYINKFILEKQKEILKKYKTGEPIEDFSAF